MGPDRTHREIALARHAERQFGAFTHEQALQVGFTTAAIKKRLTRGVWARLDYRVYRQAGTPEDWEQRLLAACMAGPAVASHRAAGLLWALPGMPQGILEVTALRHRRRKAPDVIWHESYHMNPRDITEVRGIQVTAPTRTFIDLGAVLEASQLEEVLNDGVRRNILSVAAIWTRLEQLGPLRRGSGRVRQLLDLHVPGRVPESVLETRFLQLVRQAGLSMPVSQHDVKLGSKRLARIDFAYPDLMIAIELDGEAYHFGERAEQRDRDRENDLVALRWRVLRFTWADVTRRPDHVIATLKSALRASA